MDNQTTHYNIIAYILPDVLWLHWGRYRSTCYVGNISNMISNVIAHSDEKPIKNIGRNIWTLQLLRTITYTLKCGYYSEMVILILKSLEFQLRKMTFFLNLYLVSFF